MDGAQHKHVRYTTGYITQVTAPGRASEIVYHLRGRAGPPLAAGHKEQYVGALARAVKPDQNSDRRAGGRGVSANAPAQVVGKISQGG